MISCSSLWEDSTYVSLAISTKNRRITSKAIKKSLLIRSSEEGHSLPKEEWNSLIIRKLRRSRRDLEKASEEQNMAITTEKCIKTRQICWMPQSIDGRKEDQHRPTSQKARPYHQQKEYSSQSQHQFSKSWEFRPKISYSWTILSQL